MKKTVLLPLSLCLVLVACATETVQRPMENQQAKQSSKFIDDKKWNDGFFIVREEDVRETIKFQNWLDSIIDNPISSLLLFEKASPVDSGYVLLRDIINKLDGIAIE
jgi:hypothetical protein